MTTMAYMDFSVDVEQCKPGSPGMFKFMGANAMTLKEGQTISFEGFCFKENTATLKWLDSRTVSVSIDSKNKRTATCTDDLMITALLDHKIRSQLLPGRKDTVIKLTEDADLEYVRHIGISIIPLCDKIRNSIPDLLATMALFSENLSSVLPSWVIQKVKVDQFKKLEQLTGTKSVARTIKHKITYEWLRNNARSGDVYCSYSNRGASTAILFGTGGVCSHVGMFLWENDKLWFVETNPPSVRRFDAATYFDQIAGPGVENFSLLQLRDDLRSKFNVGKAWQTFYSLQGKPYGFENIIFSFWDTPNDSFTHLASVDFVMTYIGILQKIPKAKEMVSRLFDDGFNNRLGTSGLNFNQIIEESARRGISIAQLGAMPERPNYQYGKTDRGERYICSALVTKLLKDAGVLSNFDITPQEFTPNDVYNLKIWKTEGLPKECVENDPYLPYCQLTGTRALMPFRWYNSITPYNRMNEKCPSKVPYNERPAGC
jgi:hypothetical protein